MKTAFDLQHSITRESSSDRHCPSNTREKSRHVPVTCGLMNFTKETCANIFIVLLSIETDIVLKVSHDFSQVNKHSCRIYYPAGLIIDE